jgi:putative transposase
MHQEYTNRVNDREGWVGHLWQGRFYSCPLDGPYLFRAIRYVERNPVRAGIVRRAEDYAWSSARAHVFGKQDPILADIKIRLRVPDWRAYLGEEAQSDTDEMRRHIKTGRPMGEAEFTGRLEALTGRAIARKKPGPRGPRINPEE